MARMPRWCDFEGASGRREGRALTPLFAVVAFLLPLAALGAQTARPTIRPRAVEQLRLLGEWKASRSVVERKIDSQLLFALDRRSRSIDARLAGIEALAVPDDGRVEVDIDLVRRADAAAAVQRVRTLGGDVHFVSSRFRRMRATIPADEIRRAAAHPGVRRIEPARPGLTQALVVSEGDRTHAADTARNLYGLDGAGIKVCALSNGVASLAYSQATGELPAVDVLPGQAGSGDEGTAMLEIVHDLAPGAPLGFATAFGGDASFAQNILDLAASGCRVIVDDVIYINESPFQDGILAAAVDEVAAQGVLYLSSAGNTGNLSDGTSGTWQGDFVPGPPLPQLPGLVPHDFGAGEVSNPVVVASSAVVLHWSDAYGTAANDYDLYVLLSDLSQVVRFSNSTQDGVGGDDDPQEIISFFGSGASPGESLVVVRAAGVDRMLNLIAFRGELEAVTEGALRGHTAAAGALSLAAAPAAEGYAEGQPSGPYPLAFDAGQASETFTADGPRRIFFSPEGALLPGAPAGDFSSTGGIVRPKPDLSAADGVATSVDGYTRFFGTSAAAPHAAALAAVYWSAFPASGAGAVRAALLDHAIDIELPGPDRDTGHGLVDLGAMLAAAGAPLRANLALGAVAPAEVLGNGDPVLDPGERWRLEIELVNVGGAAAQTLSGALAVEGGEAVVLDPGGSWTDLAAGGSAWTSNDFEFEISPAAVCGTILRFVLTAQYQGGIAPESLPFSLTLGAPGERVRFVYGGPPVFIADTAVRGVPGPPALAPLALSGLAGRLTDLDISFDGELCTIAQFASTVGIEHPFVSNLLIELVAPSGTVVPVVHFTDGIGNHFCQTQLDDESDGPSIQTVETDDNPFTGSFRPAQALALFDGEDPNGLWTLRITDWNPLDVGYIRAFSMTATPAVCRGFGGTVEIPAAGPGALLCLALLLALAGMRLLAGRRQAPVPPRGAIDRVDPADRVDRTVAESPDA
jgi:subtilisin family serine protease